MGRHKGDTSQMEPWEKAKTPLARRLSAVIKDPASLAAHLGVSTAAISQYKNGGNQPTLNNLVKIADFYGVSADYLLGISDVPMVVSDAKAVCNYTGVSWPAAERLHCAAASPNPGEHNQTAAVNALLEYKHGHVVLELIDAYIHFSYDAFRRDGNVYSTVGLIHSEDPDGEGLLVRPSTVKAALLSEISTQLALLSEELKRGNNNG